MVEIAANLHMHTPYSDGGAYHDDIAAAAAEAKLDVVLTTDHNIYLRGIEGYRSGVLVLTGEEVHDPERNPQSSHCLIYNAGDEMAGFAARPQRLIDETKSRGGLSFFAHPIEYASRLRADLEDYSWRDWDVRGNTGIEIWNYMTSFKAALQSWPALVLFALFPSLGVTGPFRATLKKWDELLSLGQPVVGIGNSDAHGNLYRLGPIARVIFPYRYLFGCVNTHLLLDKPFTRELEADRARVYAALRAGRCFVGYDLIAPTRGFRFSARSGSEQAVMGDRLVRKGAVKFEVTCPGLAQIRLLRDGVCVASATDEKLVHTTSDPGVYRVECYRRFRLIRRGWIFSNPIYVA